MNDQTLSPPSNRSQDELRITRHPDFRRLNAEELREDIEETDIRITEARLKGDGMLEQWFIDRRSFAAAEFCRRTGTAPQTKEPAAEPNRAIDSAAFYGLAGDIARTVEPFSESDPVAILINTLAAFGNVIGSSAHFLVDKHEHHLNLFVVQVGKSSKARKGTAWSTPRYLFSKVDPAWGATRVQGGLSSGEGLIYAVRDARHEKRPVREKGRVVDYESVMVDEGVTDKRLLCVEEEFAQALKMMSREGNILSSTIRNAWDGGRLAPMTKNSPIAATGAHVSIIAHITKDELLRHLNNTEQCNGFANRFIWFYLERSKFIPDPTGTPEHLLEPLIDRLVKATEFARGTTLLRRDEAAAAVWRDVYSQLSEEKPGLVGSITARAEAQVLRLGGIYALLDLSPVVRVEHLEAALALYEYSESCARLIFGSMIGDPIVDRIVEALRQEALTESEIANLFGRHGYESIDRGLAFLQTHSLAEPVVEATGGRPRTVWRLTNSAQKAQKGFKQ